MRYQIWNKTDDIITPSGAQFTATEWANRYPWALCGGAYCCRSGISGSIDGNMRGRKTQC